MSAPTTTTYDPSTRRVPPMGGFSVTLFKIELLRMLRNRRTVVFTLIRIFTKTQVTQAVAGLIGVPLGVAVEKATLTSMGNAIGRHLPPSVTHTYTAGLLIPLLAGGIVIALLGALLPAGWAARTRTATALRTE